MTQQYIDFGSFPDDPSADSIRESFQKVQDNFTDLYTNSLKQGVLELVPGFGLRSEDDRIAGNLVLYANIPNVTVSTPYTLENGLTNLRVKPRTSPSYGNIAIISDATPIDIDLAPNIKTANANFTGTMKAANLQVYGEVQTDLIPQGDEILNLGSPTRRWRDLYLSGNTLKIGTQSISSDSTGFVMTGAVVTDSISVGTVEATTVYGAVTTTEQPLVTKIGTLSELAISGDTTSQGNLSLVGNLDSYAVNASTMNVSGSFTAGTITGNIVLPPGATIDAPGGSGADMQIIFNDGGKQAAVPGLSYNKLDSLLTIQGNVEGGNLNTSGALAVTGTATVGGLATGGSIHANSGAISGGSIISLGILTATDTITGGNVSTSGYLSVSGNASIGNITAVNSITGNVMSIAGNISGANLVASGILKVDGAANVGSLTTSGQVSAATLRATASVQVDGDYSSASGNIVLTNGKLAGASLYSTGLADITGQLLARSDVQANGILKVLGNATTLGNVSMGSSAKLANTLAIGANLVITGTSGNGTHATLTFAEQEFAPFVTGSHIAVSGLVPSTYNVADVAVVSCTTTSVTYPSSGTGTMVTPGRVVSIGTGLTVVGNVSGGNLNIAGILRAGDSNMANVNAVGSMTVSETFSATKTITGGNLSTGGTLSVTNTATVGNLSTGGLISASGNITGGNLVTTGTTRAASLEITTGGASITGTVTGTLFSGNGASLTNLNSTVLSTTITTTGASGTGSVVTLTYLNPGFIPFYAGQSITVSGVIPSGYNGTFTVVSATSTQVTFNHTATGTQTTAGTIVGGSRSASAQQADNATLAAGATTVLGATQTNITTLGTLTGLTLNGSGTISGASSIAGGNVQVTSYFLHSLATGITATGSTQGGAYVLSKEVNVITTATASTADGIQLPVPPASTSLQVVIINASASAIKVYPSSSAQIDGLGTNTNAVLGVGGKLVLFSTSTTQWYTLTSIYS
jgi:hypothetical protein